MSHSSLFSGMNVTIHLILAGSAAVALSLPRPARAGLDTAARCRTREAAGSTSALAPPKPRTLINRGVVRGLRQQHGSGADDRALPALTPGRNRMARRLAADLRRRGSRLGRRAG